MSKVIELRSMRPCPAQPPRPRVVPRLDARMEMGLQRHVIAAAEIALRHCLERIGEIEWRIATARRPDDLRHLLADHARLARLAEELGRSLGLGCPAQSGAEAA